MSLNGCRRLTTKQNGLLTLALYRSFSRSTMGLRLPQISFTFGVTPEERQRNNDNTSNQSDKNWVNVTCVAVAALGLGFSLFSTRQLCDDPKRRVLWKKD